MFQSMRNLINKLTQSNRDSNHQVLRQEVSDETANDKIVATSRKYVSQASTTDPVYFCFVSRRLSTSFDLADANTQCQIVDFRNDERRYGVVGLGIRLSATSAGSDGGDETFDETERSNHRAATLAVLEANTTAVAAAMADEDDNMTNSSDEDNWSLPYSSPRSFSGTANGTPSASPTPVASNAPSHETTRSLPNRMSKRHGHPDRSEWCS